MKRFAIAKLALITFLILPIAASADSLRFKSKLSGAQEVPAVMTDASSDMEVKFAGDLSKATFKLKVKDIGGVVAAHLHCAPAGVNGRLW